MKTFLERAENALNLGFAVIPLLPKKKDPATHLATRGASSRTRDIRIIREWADKLPDANVGVCADENITIFESDDEPRLREAIREISKRMFGEARELPRTLTSQARDGRPHWFFRNTAKSSIIKESPGVEGMFEWRHYNQYVVGPGSVHPLGMEYRIIVDAPIATMPDWLVDVIWEMWGAYKGSSNRASGFVKVGPAGVFSEAYQKQYEFDIEKLLADDDFKLEVSAGERHYFLQSVAGALHNGELGEEELFDLLCRIRDKFCVGADEKGDREIRRSVRWVLEREPCNFGKTGYWVGARVYASKEEYEAERAAEKLFSEERGAPGSPQAPTVIEKPTAVSRIPYPIEVWEGTEYAEYADICSRGNYIPKEFFVESIKTATGAVLGESLSIKDMDGGNPRFYTVLIGDGGSGKGSAISRARSVFEDMWEGLTFSSPLLWQTTTPMEEVAWKTIGACRCGFSSAVGMQRTANAGQKRWLQIYEELSSWTESAGIEGSGQALLAVQRQLYDGDDFTTTATAKRDAGAGKALNSVLGCTTPELWSQMFAGKHAEGSGLFQRFNIIGVEGSKRVATLMKPPLKTFKNIFCSRIMELDGTHVEIVAEEAAIQRLDEWMLDPRFQTEDTDDYGRLNILAWRNALHLAWLKGRKTIGLSEINAGIKLSEYQYVMRQLYKPAQGNNQQALLEDKLRRLLRNSPEEITMREAKRKINANRYGLRAWDLAVQALRLNKEIEEGAGSRGQKTLIWVGEGA